MTRYDIAKFYGYNSPEEYDEAQRRLHENFVESKEKQKPYVEKEPVKIQPVKRGKWLHFNSDGIIFCSECKHYAYWDTDYGQQLFDYCPYCGADMRGDT